MSIAVHTIALVLIKWKMEYFGRDTNYKLSLRATEHVHRHFHTNADWIMVTINYLLYTFLSFVMLLIYLFIEMNLPKLFPAQFHEIIYSGQLCLTLAKISKWIKDVSTKFLDFRNEIFFVNTLYLIFTYLLSPFSKHFRVRSLNYFSNLNMIEKLL